ncbi:tripartite tricarboxylate transporter substrate binding protein [Aureimonas altamirensis]|uniref:Bug family tripartite tricarboxylate transporter substrate binding protein n=1 Tax=Aureimonas altamirensis TaxID=370622 RepID=UPI001E293D22|nr:tripartite tricarboxylate transporter substrate binding protein [Aureimonas altamirensis]UHD46756.1 tripartite tricarboxylate transporter substrate binding protein [Aureimonas altamirensis]
MLRRTFLASSILALTAAGVLPAAAQSDFPQRPIQMIVPWGAGGGTDAVGRIVATLLQQELGVPINVVNRTGGSGVVGHSAIANARPDGYTIGIMTIEIDMMHWMGLTQMTYEDFDILAMMNADPAGLMVSADSPYQDAPALLAAIKEQPAGTFKASGTGQGGIWHLGLAGWLLSHDLAPNHVTFVPSQGAATGITDMVAGGVDLIPSSLAEGRSMIEAGRVKALGTMSEGRQEAFPDVPTIKEALDSDWTLSVWRTVAAPKGLPDDVKAKLEAALEKVYNTDEYQKFMRDRGFGVRWAGGAEATQIVAQDDATLGEVMKKAGLAK